MGATAGWDPAQYLRFADDRSRPFFDLLARVPTTAPRRVVDVGCGPGQLTLHLKRRWPQAQVLGFDSSLSMVAEAQKRGEDGLEFRLDEAQAFRPEPDVDVLFSNATLHWVPDHTRLLEAWAQALPRGAAIAIQMPGNFLAPSHALLHQVCHAPRWKERLAGTTTAPETVRSPQDYHRVLSRAGMTVDAWETTYVHLLQGENAVLEWMKGTSLRPMLSALNPAEGAQFLDELGALLNANYPPDEDGTRFAFRRVFFVAVKP